MCKDSSLDTVPTCTLVYDLCSQCYGGGGGFCRSGQQAEYGKWDRAHHGSITGHHCSL